MQAKAAQLPLSDRLLAWFETNKKAALWGGAAIILAGLVIGFFNWQHEQKELAASEALSRVASGQLGQAQRSDMAQAYLKVEATYPNSSAAARASLLAAGSFFVAGNYSEAQAEFERFIRDYHDNPLLGEAQLGVATCLDAEGKTDPAIAAYKDLIARHTGEAFIPQAKFSLARLYMAQNKPDQARDLLEEVERTDPFYGPEAGMRIEEINAKFPKAASPAASLTAPVSPAVGIPPISGSNVPARSETK